MNFRWPLSWFILAITALFVPNAAAQVWDEAKFFSREAGLLADKQLRQLGQRYRLTLVLETFDQVPANIAEIVKDKAQRSAAFRQWAEQRRAAHHAHLYILICRQPGRVEIAMHESLSSRFPRPKLEALRETLVKHLRDKQYDTALREGVLLISQVLAESAGVRDKAKPAGGVISDNKPDAASQPVEDAPQKNKWSWVFWAILIGIGLIVVLAIIRGLVNALSGPATAGPPGTPGPGYGGYGGGGFLGAFLAGMFGAALGSWLYDRFFHGGTQAYGHEGPLPMDNHPPSPGMYGEDPTSRYAPETGEVITTGTDFQANSASDDGTGADFGDLSESLGSADIDAENYDSGGLGGDFDTGDFDASGFDPGDFGGGDFGGDW